MLSCLPLLASPRDLGTLQQLQAIFPFFSRCGVRDVPIPPLPPPRIGQFAFLIGEKAMKTCHFPSPVHLSPSSAFRGSQFSFPFENVSGFALQTSRARPSPQNAPFDALNDPVGPPFFSFSSMMVRPRSFWGFQYHIVFLTGVRVRLENRFFLSKTFLFPRRAGPTPPPSSPSPHATGGGDSFDEFASLLF